MWDQLQHCAASRDVLSAIFTSLRRENEDMADIEGIKFEELREAVFRLHKVYSATQNLLTLHRFT